MRRAPRRAKICADAKRLETTRDLAMRCENRSRTDSDLRRPGPSERKYAAPRATLDKASLRVSAGTSVHNDYAILRTCEVGTRLGAVSTPGATSWRMTIRWVPPTAKRAAEPRGRTRRIVPRDCAEMGPEGSGFQGYQGF